MVFKKRVVQAGLWVFLFTLLLIFISNIWVISSTKSRVFSDISQLPVHRVALVLGTSHRLTSGGPNPFFENRIRKAAELYTAGKADHFILSGDNRTPYYNEPMVMKKALMRLGVPETAITLDYAGLRTLDSIVRCKEIFGQDNIIIITQTFHSYRALFIGDYFQMKAIVYTADEPSGDLVIKILVREYLARTKAVLDLYVLGTAPRHLGEKEPINL